MSTKQKKAAKGKTATVETKAETTAQDIKLSEITKSPFNPRKYFDEVKLNELAESIKKVGVIQAITLRPKPNQENVYELVCGERRYRASEIAGKDTIPAIVRNLTDEQVMEIALIENFQREDISPIEEAEAIKLFIDSKKEDVYSMAARLGKSVTFIKDRYQLNNLIDDFKLLVNQEVIKIGIAVVIASYDSDVQSKVYEEHYTEDAGYNTWRNLKMKEVIDRLNRLYNCDLDDAEFNKEECLKCRFNSSITDLFALEGNCHAQCLNKLCFAEKVKNHKISTILAYIGQNPEVYVICASNVEEWLTNALTENDIETHSYQSMNYESAPDVPEKPIESEYADEDGVLDEDWFEDAMTDYNEELAEYEAEMKIYDDKKKQGILFDAVFLRYNYFEIGFCEKSLEEVYTTFEEVTEETGTEEPKPKMQRPKVDISFELSRIKDLHDKDTRNAEIKVENTVQDIKDKLFRSDVDLTNQNILPIEEVILYFFLFDDMTSEHKKLILNSRSYCSDDEQLTIVRNLDDSQKLAITRDYFIKKLKERAYSANSVSSQLLIELSMLYFPTETQAIVGKYEDIYKKRKQSIEEKIGDYEKDIKSKQLEANEETQTETTEVLQEDVEESGETPIETTEESENDGGETAEIKGLLQAEEQAEPEQEE